MRVVSQIQSMAYQVQTPVRLASRYPRLSGGFPQFALVANTDWWSTVGSGEAGGEGVDVGCGGGRVVDINYVKRD